MGLEAFFSGIDPAVTGAGSLTALDPSRWRDTAAQLSAAGLWVHIDIMDGIFTPRAGVPIQSLAWLRDALGPIDVHLMVDQPDAALPQVLALSPQRVTVHIERLPDAVHTAGSIRAARASPWLAVSPRTPIDGVKLMSHLFDGVLVMLVVPGTADDADLSMQDRLRHLQGTATLGVDGGVTADNVALWVGSGARYVVAGRALVGGATASS